MFQGIAAFLSRHLSRRTTGRVLIPEVDGLRSVAILSVVFFHANANFRFYTGDPKSSIDSFIHRIFDAGEYGVPLFFVISGFILTIPFARHYLEGADRVSLRKYLIRRLTRLEPPYIFALVVLFLITAFRTGSFEYFPSLVASGAYLHNAVYGQSSHVLVAAWSLEVEVQFYLLAPLLTTVFAIRNSIARRGIMLVAIALMSYFFNVVKPIDGLSIISHGSYFLVGIFLADIYLGDQRRYKEMGQREDDQHLVPRTSGGYLFDLIVFAALSMVFVAKAYSLSPELVAPWLILIGYAAVFRARLVRWFFRFSPVVILGGMCYTIYLWHFFLIAGFRHVWFRMMPVEEGAVSRVAYVLVASTVAVVLSGILFALIERPTMNPRWPQELWAFLTKRSQKDR
ncbi:MAG: acyltransferase family protein [Phycisphaerales bacterium]